MGVDYSISTRKHNQCWHCEERSAGCHSTCEKYAEFVAFNQKLNEAERIEKLIGYHPFGKNGKSYFIPRRSSYETN